MLNGALPQDASWYQLSWDAWVSVAGSILGVVGLYLTYLQAKGAKTSAEAAREAAKNVSNQLQNNQLFLQTAELRWIVTSLEEAIASDSRPMARHFLAGWRHSVGQLHGTLLSAGNMSDADLSKIQASLGLARTAVTTIEDPSRTLAVASKRARNSINEAYDAINSWIGERAYDTTGTGGS